MVLALGAPASAAGHAIVRAEGAGITYLAEDEMLVNTLQVRLAGPEIELADRTVTGGMDPGSCRRGEVNGDAWVVQAFCPAAGVTALYVDLGDRDDTATVDVPVATTLLGGLGADRVTTGPGADAVAGDAGDDTLSTAGGDDRVTGGGGADTLQAGPGDDAVLARDGEADAIGCGDGTDTVQADQLDVVAVDCEAVARALVTPPGAADRTAPRLRVGAARIQRLRGGRTVRLRATSGERGVVRASGVLRVAGASLALKAVRRRVDFAGRSVALAVRLTDGQLRRVRRALRRGHRVEARLGVVATDAAGNSSRRDAPRIRLR